MRRVVVTGMGAVSALGYGCGELWSSLAAGRSGIGPIRRPMEAERLGGTPEDHPWAGAAVPGYDPARWFDERRLGVLDPVSQFALLAAREAAAQSGLDFRNGLGERTTVLLGTGVGGDHSRDEASFQCFGRLRRVAPFTILRTMANAAACHVSIELGITGPSYTVSDACTSAAHAIGLAFQHIRHGLADAAVVGGSEVLPSTALLQAWRSMRVMAPDTCRPFARSRKGLVLGEGAGMLVLEPLGAARRRGAPILAELTGYGSSSDAGDLVMPSVDGISAALRAALRDARLEPGDVGYINAHGTGTRLNDLTETRALKEVFGAAARGLAISSTKSMHGHALGATGALELIATIQALREGVVPPTINYDEPDPECDLDYTPNEARTKRLEVALSSSFGFGGLNGVLAVQRFQG